MTDRAAGDPNGAARWSTGFFAAALSFSRRGAPTRGPSESVDSLVRVDSPDEKQRVDEAQKRALRLGYRLFIEDAGEGYRMLARNVAAEKPQPLGSFAARSEPEAFEMAVWKLERIAARQEPWPS